MNATVLRHTAGRATLALPSAWQQVHLDRSVTDEAQRFAAAWSIPASSESAGFLTGAITAARRAGVVFAAVLAGDGDLPVYGSLVCAELSSEPWSAARIEIEWRAAGRDCATISLPVGPAVRATRPATLAGERGGWELQLAIPALDEGGMLMSFSTPVAQLAEFFDPVATAIASTVRWKEARPWKAR